ncbi:MAG: hypothetical protein ACM31L_15460 [Actinomycetota bacterium]
MPALMVVFLLAAFPADAAQWLVVRWIGPSRCEVVTAPPRFGRWEEVATYDTRGKADKALDALRRKGLCRAVPVVPEEDAPRPPKGRRAPPG